MISRVTVAVLIAIGLAGGCAPKSTGVPAAISRVEIIETVETDADRLLDYYSYMSELQGDSLRREYQRVQRLFDDDPNDRNRMQMIMLLSSQSATFKDTHAAKGLLDIWLDDQYNTYSKLRPLAVLFNNYLTQVHRLDEAIARQASMLGKTSKRAARHAQKLDVEKKQTAALQEKLDVEKDRTAALQKKLDALLEMEMNLIEREQITAPDTQ